MLKNHALVAKFGVDTAENEPSRAGGGRREARVEQRVRREGGGPAGRRGERHGGQGPIEPFEPFENLQNFCNFLLNFGDLSGAKDCKSCRSRKMLKNDALVAKFGVDTAENEPSKV